MAWLDMSDVITDPDLSEPADGNLLLVRNVQTIGGDGMAANVEDVVPIGGVVCATGGQVARSPDGEMTSDGFTIHTLTPLTSGRAPNVPADILVWEGNRYTVVNVSNFSRFGAGFFMAECELLSIQGGT